MDVKKIPELLSLSEHPVGFGGCRNNEYHLDCCEYNISVFDDKLGESVHDLSGNLIKLHHCSLSESNVSILTQLENLTILYDDQWKLTNVSGKNKGKEGKNPKFIHTKLVLLMQESLQTKPRKQ